MTEVCERPVKASNRNVGDCNTQHLSEAGPNVHKLQCTCSGDMDCGDGNHLSSIILDNEMKGRSNDS